MATWATSFWPPSAVLRARSDQHSATTVTAMADADPLALTGIPYDDIYLYCKHIDNSRTVRQADARATSEWTTIGGVCMAAAMVAAMLIYPGVQSVRDSYKVQDLKREQTLLRNDLRKLDVQEELIVSAARLDTTASDHHLARPKAGQVVRLQPKNNHSFARNGFNSR
jgi:hypothetical protein